MSVSYLNGKVLVGHEKEIVLALDEVDARLMAGALLALLPRDTSNGYSTGGPANPLQLLKELAYQLASAKPYGRDFEVINCGG